MDYINPYGVSGTRPPYQNGNPSAGIQGSVPDVRCWEYPMREIVAVIEAAGLVASNGDLTQLYKAILALTTSNTPSVGSLWHIGSASGGVSSAYTTSLSPNVPAGASNFFFSMPVSVANTLVGGNTTIDFGLGPKNVYKNWTAAPPASGEMTPGLGIFYFDGTSVQWVNPPAPAVPSSASSAIISLPTQQILSNATVTRIGVTGSLPFGTVSGGVVTITKAGLYSVQANTTTTQTPPTGGGTVSTTLQITKNGSQAAINGDLAYNSSTGTNQTVGTQAILYLSLGDTIEFDVYMGNASASVTSIVVNTLLATFTKIT